VDQTGHGAFSCSSLTQNKNRNICLRKQFGLGTKLLRERSETEKEFVLSDYFNIFARYLRLRTIVLRSEMSANN